MKPTYTPNPADVATANSAVMAAYEKLDERDQRNITALARRLIEKVKEKNSRMPLSMEGAIEVIGKCGMEMAKERTEEDMNNKLRRDQLRLYELQRQTFVKSWDTTQKEQQ